MDWRLLIASAAAMPALWLSPLHHAHAAADGGKPLHLIVPYAPGSPMDTLARLLAKGMYDQESQIVVVDNRPDVDGLVGTEMAKDSLPDGHTAVIVSTEFAMYAALGRRLPYNPIRDFTPVTQLADRQLLLVIHPSVPAKNVKQLVMLAKREPGKLRYASRSAMDALPLELFKMTTGAKIVRTSEGQPTLSELVDNQIQVDMADASVALPSVRESRLRALAVGDSRRWSTLPELPTMAEAGVRGYRAVLWSGILAPARTPYALVKRMNASMVKVVHSPLFREALAQSGAEAVGNTPYVWRNFLHSELAKWHRVAHAAKLKFD